MSDTPMTSFDALALHRLSWLLEQLPPHLRTIAASRELPPEEEKIRRRLDAEADAKAHAERIATQREFRERAWNASCPPMYREASLGRLYPQQNLKGAVAGWLCTDSPVLELHGPSQHGKTYAAWAVASEARGRGMWVAGWRATDLLNLLRPSDSEPERPDRTRIAAGTADLVVLDDLGREKLSEWVIDQLYDLLEARLTGGLRTIITTNLSRDQLVKRYGDPVTIRIADKGTRVPVRGKVIRPPA